MRPLEPLASSSQVDRALKSEPPEGVRLALAEARARLHDDEAAARDREAALGFAEATFALREGELDRAVDGFARAAAAFSALGRAEAALLARADGLVAVLRRGPRDAQRAATRELAALEEEARAANSSRAACVALHYRATGERLSGDADAALRTLLGALEASEPFPDERARVLNSLGTLYVTLGATGAAEPLLEHAAELHVRFGDVIGEAIAHGQLGAAALARGEIELAKRHLQRQEWLATRVGDVFGRARALTFLAECALELGRSDEAKTLASRARAIAESATPPLRLLAAYAARASARAKVELADPDAAAAVAEAESMFRAFDNPLGIALARWDAGRLAARADTSRGGDVDACSTATLAYADAARGLANLGLSARVAQLVAERRAGGAAGELAAALALAQAHPHVAVALEVDLVFRDPRALVALVDRRGAATRNAARTAALSLEAPGLVLVGIAHPSIRPASAMPDLASGAACVLATNGACVWAFPASAADEAVAADVARFTKGLPGEAAVVSTQRAPRARVVGPGFSGEVGASVECEAGEPTPLEVLLAAARPAR